MPPWNHLHPAIVHFPIALLTVAPLLVLLGVMWKEQRRGLHAAALLLLLLGFGGLLLALRSGDAVERYARATPALLAGLQEHERAAQRTTLLFGMLGLAFTVLWCLPLLKREVSRVMDACLLMAWLLLSGLGLLALARTGHLGGHLVHDLHTHAGPEPPLN